MTDGRWWGRSHPKKRAIDTWRLIKQPCLNGRNKRRKTPQKKKTVEKKKNHTHTHIGGLSTPGSYQYKKTFVVGFPDPRWTFTSPMLSATHVIPFISFFIAMSQSPIEVDLTDDTPSHWTTQGATTPPAGTTAAAEFPTCAICLQDIHRTAIGPNAPYDWPACSHPIHLSCAMQHMSHQAQPACPTCRQQWTQDGQYRLEQVGQTNAVPWMVPETPHDTRNLHTQPPPAPDQPIFLCCPRLASSTTTTRSWTHLGGNSQQDTWNGP